MRVICAWCGRVMVDGPDPTTHGICRSCALRVGSPEADPAGWPFDVATVPADARSILITGGSPAHWDSAALALHRTGALVAIACGESDAAAFDEALRRSAGGTLLLRYVDEATPAQQERLLLLVSSRHDGRHPPPERVISGSRRALSDLVAAGLFDEGLFRRLNGWHVALDPR